MRWSGSGPWIGVAVASLAVGAALLRPRSPSGNVRVANRGVEGAATAVRDQREPAPPLVSRSVPRLSTTPSAPPVASAVRWQPALASPARIEQPVPTPSALALPGVAPAATVVGAEAAPQVVVGAPRRVSLSALSAWSKPGLCSTSEDAEATRETLTARFRRLLREGAQLHFDPRLQPGTEADVLLLLGNAGLEVHQQLGLQPPAPPVFNYFDQQLMKAAACINEDVVAFYDGALHLVANRSDLQQSVTHELTHHALFASGLVGPAWAQEGIAMLVARETWWKAPARLQAVLRTPFSAEQMEELIPYKLPADQAVGFYVQSALTVQCLLARRGWSLQQLAEALRNGSGPDSVSYDLPELQESSFSSNCLATLVAR
jgi:hypothetical protein